MTRKMKNRKLKHIKNNKIKQIIMQLKTKAKPNTKQKQNFADKAIFLRLDNMNFKFSYLFSFFYPGGQLTLAGCSAGLANLTLAVNGVAVKVEEETAVAAVWLLEAVVKEFGE